MNEIRARFIADGTIRPRPARQSTDWAPTPQTWRDETTLRLDRLALDAIRAEQEQRGRR